MSHSADDYQKPAYYLADEFTQFWEDNGKPLFCDKAYFALLREFEAENDLNHEQLVELMAALSIKQLDKLEGKESA